MPRPNAIGVAIAVLASSAVVAAPLHAAAAYRDAATAEWFAALASPYTRHCCDQADCKLALSDYRDGAWWALSNRTGTWVRIDKSQITDTVSIFKDAVLCEGDPMLDYGAGPGAASPAYAPRVYCFAPPPIGF